MSPRKNPKNNDPGRTSRPLPLGNTTRSSSSRPPAPRPTAQPNSSSPNKTKKRPSSTSSSSGLTTSLHSPSTLPDPPLPPNQRFTSSVTRPRAEVLALDPLVACPLEAYPLEVADPDPPLIWDPLALVHPSLADLVLRADTALGLALARPLVADRL